MAVSISSIYSQRHKKNFKTLIRENNGNMGNDHPITLDLKQRVAELSAELIETKSILNDTHNELDKIKGLYIIEKTKVIKLQENINNLIKKAEPNIIEKMYKAIVHWFNT